MGGASGGPGRLRPPEPLRAPLSGRLAVIYALPVGDTGAVMAAVVYTGEPPVDVPGLVEGVRLVVLDPDRTQVIATSPGVDMELGTKVAGTDLARRITGNEAVGDLDGTRRYYREAVVPRLEWHMLAGYDEDVALASAHSQRRWLLGISAAVGVVLLLALPLRRLASALGRSREGDDSARAPIETPTAVVRGGSGHVPSAAGGTPTVIHGGATAAEVAGPLKVIRVRGDLSVLWRRRGHR